MTYLDISPMIVALGDQPHHFELRGVELHHIPSRHSFGFTRGSSTAITRAWCDCAGLPISAEQSLEFKTVFDNWMRSYWQPLLASQTEAKRVAKVNRHFASHFKPNVFLRFMRWLFPPLDHRPTFNRTSTMNPAFSSTSSPLVVPYTSMAATPTAGAVRTKEPELV